MHIDELVRIHNNVAHWIRDGLLPITAELVPSDVLSRAVLRHMPFPSVADDIITVSVLRELSYTTLTPFLNMDVSSERDLLLSETEISALVRGIGSDLSIPIQIIQRKLFKQLELPFDKSKRPEALCNTVGLIYDALEDAVSGLRGPVERASARSLAKQVGVDNPKVRARYAYCLISSESLAKVALAEPVLRGTFDVGKVLAKDVFDLLCESEEKVSAKVLVEANAGYDVLKNDLRSKDAVIASAASRESDLRAKITSLERTVVSSSGLSQQNDELQAKIEELSAQLSSLQASHDYAVNFAELCLEERRAREVVDVSSKPNPEPDMVVYASPAFQSRMSDLRHYKSPNDDADFPVVVDRVLGVVKTLIKDNGVGSLRSFRTLHRSGVFMYDQKSTALVFKTDFKGELTLCDVLTPEDRRQWHKSESGRFAAVKNGKESYVGERRLISSVSDIYTTA